MIIVADCDMKVIVVPSLACWQTTRLSKSLLTNHSFVDNHLLSAVARDICRRTTAINRRSSDTETILGLPLSA